MYRLERTTDYILNGKKDVILVEESSDLTRLTDEFLGLVQLPHFGHYQIIKTEVIKSERNRTDENKTESNKL